MTNSEIIDSLQGKYHNPAGLGQDRIGPHHRLLTQDELSKPLPEGAEYWDTTENLWIRSAYIGRTIRNYDKTNNTYRIPLALSDRMKAERDRLDEQIKIVEAVEKGARYEIEIDGKWYSPGEQYECVKNLMENLEHKDRRARIKPAAPTPRSIPWTLESHPDVVCVVSKTDLSEHYSVTRWRPNSAWIDGKGWLTYDVLHSDWLRRNGEPAGQEVEG